MKFSLCITRTLSGRDNPTPYNIEITDEASRTRIRLSLSAEQFADALSNTHVSEVKGEIMGVAANIGKRKVIEARKAKLLRKDVESIYDKDLFSKWLEENKQEEGWYLDSYLGSQKSIIFSGEEVTLNYSVYKWE